MPDPVMPAAAPMSAMDTAWYPLRATRSAAAARMRSLRAGSLVRGAAVSPVTVELPGYVLPGSRACSALCVVAGELLPDHVLLDFAGRGLGQLVGQDDGLGRLVRVDEPLDL